MISRLSARARSQYYRDATTVMYTRERSDENGPYNVLITKYMNIFYYVYTSARRRPRTPAAFVRRLPRENRVGHLAPHGARNSRNVCRRDGRVRRRCPVGLIPRRDAADFPRLSTRDNSFRSFSSCLVYNRFNSRETSRVVVRPTRTDHVER